MVCICVCVQLAKVQLIVLSLIDNSLLAFSDRRRFWVIAPGKPLLTACNSEQFYCDPAILVSSSSFFIQSFTTAQICGDVDIKFFFGVTCVPG